MTIFEATEGQVKQMAANAANASRPMGSIFMGEAGGYIDDDFEVTESGLHMEYMGAVGRMVKLSIDRIGEDRWQIKGPLSNIHHSWLCEYPTAQALIGSVK